MSCLGLLISLFDRPERKQLALLSLALLISSVLEVVGIGLILPFINVVSAPGTVLKHAQFGPWLIECGIASERALIVAACIVVLVITLLKSVSVLLTMRWSYRFTYQKVLYLQKRVLQSYLNAPYLFHLHHNTARLIKNATYEPEAVGSIVKFALFLPTELVIVVGLASLLLITQPTFALLGIMALGMVMWAIGARSRRELSILGKVREKRHGEMIQWVNQSLGGIKELKLLRRESFFTDALFESGSEYVGALSRSALVVQYPRLILESAALLLIVLFVLSVVLTGRDLQSVVGALALFGMAIVRLVPSATRITNAIQTIRFHSASIDAVVDAIDAGRQSPDAPIPLSPIAFDREIRIESLSYRYPDADEDCIAQVSLTIQKGSHLGFVGMSGSGKTTLANLLLGLLEPTSGRILVDGIDVRQKIGSWQRHLGYIPQDIYLIDDTIRRNVAFGVPEKEINEKAVWRALEAAQLSSFVKTLSRSLDTVVGERGVRISAGQRQRIGIARALYHDPQVLLLDEATSALDNETERLFAEAMGALRGQKTVLVIAHRLRTVRHCDHLFLMEHGRIVARGTFEDLARSEPSFAHLMRGHEPALA